MDPFCAAVRVMARFWIRFFFERIEARRPGVPRRGPVLLCINHPNNLIDSLLVGSLIVGVVQAALIDTVAFGRAVDALYRGELERELWDERGLSEQPVDPFPFESIVTTIGHFRQQDPRRNERLWQRLLGYHVGLAAYRLRDDAVRTRLEGPAARQRGARSRGRRSSAFRSSCTVQP